MYIYVLFKDCCTISKLMHTMRINLVDTGLRRRKPKLKKDALSHNLMDIWTKNFFHLPTAS